MQGRQRCVGGRPARGQERQGVHVMHTGAQTGTQARTCTCMHTGSRTQTGTCTHTLSARAHTMSQSPNSIFAMSLTSSLCIISAMLIFACASSMGACVQAYAAMFCASCKGIAGVTVILMPIVFDSLRASGMLTPCPQ